MVFVFPLPVLWIEYKKNNDLEFGGKRKDEKRSELSIA